MWLALEDLFRAKWTNEIHDEWIRAVLRDRPELAMQLERTRELMNANVRRQAVWCPQEQPDLSFRGNELAGEVGEVCNVIKKLERERHGWRGSRDSKEHLAEELGDVVICVSLIALTAGIDLEKAVREKFNATSAKVGIEVTL